MKKKILKKRIFYLFVALILLVTFSSSFVAAQNNVVQVESSLLNVREGPGLSYTVMDQLQQGEHVNILEERNEWHKIRLSNDRIGWIASWNISQDSPEVYNNTYARIINDFANVRQYPSADSNLLGTVYQGTELEVLYTENNWVQVQYMGNLGWIRNDLLEVYEGSQMPEIKEGEPETDGMQKIAPAQQNLPIDQATIVIDPGHGGGDPGATSDTFYEKDVALNTSSRLAQRLKDAGANVIMTRTDDSDVSLADRALISNYHGAHAFLSIHYDASPEPNSRSGTSTYYYDENDTILADTINSFLNSYGLLENHGVHFGDFQVLRENSQPAILLELGYVNHSNDQSLINTDYYQNIIVEALYQGLIDYFQ